MNHTLDTLPPLRETVQQFGLAADKRLGQHFLFDLNLTHKITRLAGDLTPATVIEIGSGPGGLTRAILAAQPTELHIVERDARAIPIAEQLQQHTPTPIHIHHADGLNVPIWQLGQTPRHIIANLPYNVGTEMLLNWLEHATAFQQMTLMFQKEVADRIIATPDDKAYGRLAVICQFYCHVSRGMDLPASAFTPPPKVDSSVVILRPRTETYAAIQPRSLSRITAAAFGQRRKMLRSSLKSLGINAETLLQTAGIDGQRRAETLSLQEFCTLAQAWEALT